MAMNGAAKFAGNYGNKKQRAETPEKPVRGGKRGALMPPPKKIVAKVKKRAKRAALKMDDMDKPKRGGRRMPEPMDDMDFGVR
jgi:hypothetical protein